jgi:two-component system, OmpR family, phosphate regulon response regulator PhoB
MSTVLVVEDEPAIQELVAVHLEHGGYDVRRAHTVAQAEAQLMRELPDVVLIDWMLPDGSGLDLARQLRAKSRTAQLPIIMLTARALEQDKLSGLEAGADDYITKPFSPRELTARIKAVLRRRAPQLTDEIVELAGLTLNPATHTLTSGPVALDLGPTEFRLLHFFMTHPERVYTRAQLLDSVWGDHVYVEERTVDVHIRRLRQALEKASREDCIETVRGTGYRFRGNAGYE